jgi:integrase
MRDALRPLRKLYGSTPAAEFAPRALRTIQEDLGGAGLCRSTINARINRIRGVFRWAVGVELIPPSVLQALQAVSGLQKGRTDARQAEEIKPVPTGDIEAALPFMPRPVAAMVQLQLLTGCQTEEVPAIRGCDLISGEPNWEYRPEHHKTQWRGQERVIPVGPRAQAIVKQYLKADRQAYLFSPQDVVEELHARRARLRKSRPTPPERARRVPGTRGRKHRACYDRRAYRQAIVPACQKAGVLE